MKVKVQILKDGKKKTVELSPDIENCLKNFKNFSEFKKAHTHIISDLKPVWEKINAGTNKLPEETTKS